MTATTPGYSDTVLKQGYTRDPLDFESTKEVFDSDYYLRGPETGKSNYYNYRWLPEKTIPCCQSIMSYLSIRPGDALLDFGAARGFYVKAFRLLGVKASGVDISKWALDNADEDIKPFMGPTLPDSIYHYVFSKDCLEHVPFSELTHVITSLLQRTMHSFFIVVPLTDKEGGLFLSPADQMDNTHQIRWTLPLWLCFLQGIGSHFVVNGSYHVPGVKDASLLYPRSCGFITCKRMEK